MNVTVETVDDVTRKVTVTLPRDLVNKELNRAYRNLQREVHLPGFRPGKVPVSLLEARFRSQVEGEVRAKLISESFEAALEENEIQPISQPEVDYGSLSRKADFTYTALVEIRPEVDATGYKGLSLSRREVVVRDADVDMQIEGLRRNKASLVEVEEERGLEEGDVARIDYVLEVDGKVVEGADGNPRNIHVPIRLDGSSFLPGFAEKVLGMTRGETRTFELDIPSDFPNSLLAGKQPRLTVTLVDIKRYELPEVDDELARDLDFETLDELQADVRRRLESMAASSAEAALRDQVIEALLSANQFQVPRGLIEMTIERLAREDQHSRGRSGPLALSEEERERYAQVADRRIRLSLILDSIAKKEKIEVSDEELDEAVKKMAAESGQRFEALRGQLLKNNLMEDVRSNVLEEKVFKFIIDNAEVTVQTEESGNGSEKAAEAGDAAAGQDAAEGDDSAAETGGETTE